MELQVGSILEGKVTSITKFGAFVALEGGKSGLVHISEIANTFVNDVHDFLQEGQTVKVLVLSTENGKINLSIKRTLPQPERPAPRGPRPGGPGRRRPAVFSKSGLLYSSVLNLKSSMFHFVLSSCISICYWSLTITDFYSALSFLSFAMFSVICSFTSLSVFFSFL